MANERKNLQLKIKRTKQHIAYLDDNRCVIEGYKEKLGKEKEKLEKLEKELEATPTATEVKKGYEAIKKIKGRAWLGVIYPESAPANWRDILQQTGIEFAVSPLHDSDLNANGEKKKEHYHIILVWQSPTTLANVVALLQPLNAPMPIKSESVKGAYAYLTHAENPEKAQYEAKDIELFNGFNISNFRDLKRGEQLALIRELQLLILSDEDIREYVDFTNEAFEMGVDYYDVATSNTTLFTAMLRKNLYANAKHKRKEMSNAEVDAAIERNKRREAACELDPCELEEREC